MRRNITLNLLKRLEPTTKAFFIRSTTLRGFGIKVNPSGAIKFIAETKYQGTNYRRELGAFPVMSIPEAEKEARQFLNHVQTGQQKEEARQQYTLEQLFKTYTSRVSLKPTTLKNYQHVIYFYLQDWLNNPVVSISKELVEKRFYMIRDNGINGGKPTYSQATKTMRILSALMNYACADELIESNPVNVLKLKRIDRSIIKREHYLKAEEVRKLLHITSNETHPMTLAVHLMLHTGMRKNEALRLKWEDIRVVNEVPCIIVRDTKNHRPHYLPVNQTIQEIIEKAKSVASAVDTTGTPSRYVFPSTQKVGQHISDERPTLKRLSKAIGVTFKCHDLRRTFATRATEVGIDYLTVKRLLNHKSNDITAQYIQWHSHENLTAIKKALELVRY